jgi:DNA-binding transcriptional LysR family regulator
VTKVNLKLLHTFMLAAEQGSFRKAAEETNRSPSAISMQIKDLEEQVGVNLFLRTPQRITLTSEGRMLLEQVKSAVTEVQAGLDQLSDLALRRKGHVRIACAPTLASTRLPNILATFKVRHPRSKVEVRELPTAASLEMLRRGEIEFFVGPSIPGMADFVFEPIAHDPVLACVPAIYDEGKDSLSLADLETTPLILLSHGTAIRGVIDSIADAAGLSLDVQYEVQQGITAIALASAGLGVAIIPRIATLQNNYSQFRLVPLSDPSAAREIGIVTLRGYVHHSYAEQLIDLFRNNFKDLR